MYSVYNSKLHSRFMCLRSFWKYSFCAFLEDSFRDLFFFSSAEHLLFWVRVKFFCIVNKCRFSNFPTWGILPLSWGRDAFSLGVILGGFRLTASLDMKCAPRKYMSKWLAAPRCWRANDRQFRETHGRVTSILMYYFATGRAFRKFTWASDTHFHDPGRVFTRSSAKHMSKWHVFPQHQTANGMS